MSESRDYPIPPGVHAIPHDELDLRPDAEVDHDLMHPKPVTDEKNVWFFWNQGYAKMPPYNQRTVRNWHRRFSKKGWAIRVMDQETGSPLNIANYLDVTDPETFPRAFIDGNVGGDYAVQAISDMVRFPLLVKYGGFYADVGMVQIGDIDQVWNETVGNPDSPYEIFTYNFGNVNARGMANYFLASGRNNPFFQRCHDLLLALWAADGGQTNVEGMSDNPLVQGLPEMYDNLPLAFEENGRKYSQQEVVKMLKDYIIQGQVITMVMGLLDEEGGWNGPQYVVDRIFAYDFTEGSQLINIMTDWNGTRQFELLSLKLPGPGEEESADQKEARNIVETCLKRCFGFKLATGLITRVHGDTLSSLWRKHTGADVIPGTYADWFRHGTIYWCQDVPPPHLKFTPAEPFKVGPLLREK